MHDIEAVRSLIQTETNKSLQELWERALKKKIGVIEIHRKWDETDEIIFQLMEEELGRRHI